MDVEIIKCVESNEKLQKQEPLLLIHNKSLLGSRKGTRFKNKKNINPHRLGNKSILKVDSSKRRLEVIAEIIECVLLFWNLEKFD